MYRLERKYIGTIQSLSANLFNNIIKNKNVHIPNGLPNVVTYVKSELIFDLLSDEYYEYTTREILTKYFTTQNPIPLYFLVSSQGNPNFCAFKL